MIGYMTGFSTTVNPEKMPHWVQTSDWSDYDSRKIAYDDRFNFSCEETWEVDYLVNKIRNFNRDKPETAIRQAIESCGKEIRSPRPRSVFVMAVMEKLKGSVTN